MIPFNPIEDLPPKPWKEHTFYVVNVSMRPGNPWHKSLLYTGFLSDGKPGGYSGLINPSYSPQFMTLLGSPLLITVEQELVTLQ